MSKNEESKEIVYSIRESKVRNVIDQANVRRNYAKDWALAACQCTDEKTKMGHEARVREEIAKYDGMIEALRMLGLC